MAQQRCRNLGGNLYEISKLNIFHFVSLENGNNWIAFKFPNSSFRWFNNDTGASQINNCFEGWRAPFEGKCSFWNCCVNGRCLVRCFLNCTNCSNSFVVLYICTKGKGVWLKIKVENLISSLLSAKRIMQSLYNWVNEYVNILSSTFFSFAMKSTTGVLFLM